VVAEPQYKSVLLVNCNCNVLLLFNDKFCFKFFTNNCCRDEVQARRLFYGDNEGGIGGEARPVNYLAYDVCDNDCSIFVGICGDTTGDFIMNYRIGVNGKLRCVKMINGRNVVPIHTFLKR